LRKPSARSKIGAAARGAGTGESAKLCAGKNLSANASSCGCQHATWPVSVEVLGGTSIAQVALARWQRG
jgi:hypothetical protein